MKKTSFILALIILFQLLLLLYRIDAPFTEPARYGKSCSRAMVARNYFRNGFRLFYPQLDVVPQPGYYASEFQLVPFIVAGVYNLTGVRDWVGRAVPIAFALATTVLLYALTRRYYGRKAGLISALFFVLAPLNLYFNRTFQSDSALVFFVVSTFQFFTLWIDSNKRSYVLLAGVCACLVLLLRPYLSILGMPIAYMAYQKHKGRMFINKDLWLVFLIAVAPSAIWYHHVAQINSYPGWVGLGVVLRRITIAHIFDWRILFQEAKDFVQALTPLGTIILLVSFFRPVKQKGEYFLHFWALALGILFFVLNDIQAHHEYYLMPWAPLAGIFVGRFFGTLTLNDIRRRRSRFLLVPMAVVILIGSAFLWYDFLELRFRHPEYAQRRFEAGKLVDSTVPRNAPILAEDVDVLYYADRKGWIYAPEGAKVKMSSLSSYIQEGAEYLITTDGNALFEGAVIEWLSENATVIAQKDGTTILYELEDM